MTMHRACIALPIELPNQVAVGMGEMVYEAGLGWARVASYPAFHTASDKNLGIGKAGYEARLGNLPRKETLTWWARKCTF